MITRRTIELTAFAIALLTAAMAAHAWLASRDEQQRLATTLAQQKQLLDAADTRERTRQTALNDTLAQIEKLKRATQTPQQIVAALPKYLSLPQPITLMNAQQGNEASKLGETQEAPSVAPPTERQALVPAPAQTAERADGSRRVPPTAPCDPSSSNCAAQIPAADLKPLYDYIQNCRACQAQLSTARQNASDDAAKIAALTAERNAAVTAAKGGTFWRRLRRNAEWFAVGAAVGAAAGYRASHR